MHARDNVDSLYVSRKNGGRGLVNFEDSVDPLIQRLEDYIDKLVGNLNTPPETIQVTSHSRKCGCAYERETKREIESLLMTAQNNAIRTNHIKAKIDKMPQNSR